MELWGVTKECRESKVVSPEGWTSVVGDGPIKFVFPWIISDSTSSNLGTLSVSGSNPREVPSPIGLFFRIGTGPWQIIFDDHGRG